MSSCDANSVIHAGSSLLSPLVVFTPSSNSSPASRTLSSHQLHPLPYTPSPSQKLNIQPATAHQPNLLSGTFKRTEDDAVVPITSFSASPDIEILKFPAGFNQLATGQGSGSLGASVDNFAGSASTVTKSPLTTDSSASLPPYYTMNQGGFSQYYPSQPAGVSQVRQGDVPPNLRSPFPAAYGNIPAGFPTQVIPNASLIPPSTLLTPGALARQQRASADEKKGKRRRTAADAKSSEAGPAVTEEKTIVEGNSQVVPMKNSSSNAERAAPVVKVKEERKKKRLLRNRVSAQQARERKRQHVVELEEQCNRLEQSNAELEERASNLAKENEELRKLVRENMKGRASGSGGDAIS